MEEDDGKGRKQEVLKRVPEHGNETPSDIQRRSCVGNHILLLRRSKIAALLLLH